MDWKYFFAVFGTIFVAEIGDKTEFAAIAAASQAKSTLPVILAVVLALSLAGILGCLLGRLLGTWVNPQVTKWVSGSLFILLGCWTLFGK